MCMPVKCSECWFPLKAVEFEKSHVCYLKSLVWPFEPKTLQYMTQWHIFPCLFIDSFFTLDASYMFRVVNYSSNKVNQNPLFIQVTLIFFCKCSSFKSISRNMNIQSTILFKTNFRHEHFDQQVCFYVNVFSCVSSVRS